jgi:hypothetical protein
MKPSPNEPKAFKWVVWFATALVAAILLGVVAVLVSSLFAWRSDAGDPCPDKVGRYLRRFAGATMQPEVKWSGCKISSGLVLRASFDLDAPGKTVLRSALKRRGFTPLGVEDMARGWVRQTDERRTVIFEYPYRSAGQFTILHAESGVR